VRQFTLQAVKTRQCLDERALKAQKVEIILSDKDGLAVENELKSLSACGSV
jgi:hypothetical protein